MVIKCCHQCHAALPKGRRKFCSNKCKERYHNLHNPRGIYAHLTRGDDDYDIEDEGLGHPFESGEMGHGQW